MTEERKIILSIDVGTTTTRCCLFTKSGTLAGIDKESTPLIFPKPGWVEIDPEEIFQLVLRLARGALTKFGYTPQDIESIAVTTLRNSFTTWSKRTGKPFHRIITWKDLRADEIVQGLNHSFSRRALNTGSCALHTVTRNNRFLAGRVLKFMNPQVLPRLLWAVSNYPDLEEAIKDGDAIFGCVDTWLIYKLTGGSLHVTDISNVSATALFDPFEQDYASAILRMFNVPKELGLPEIRQSNGDFGTTIKDHFGVALPINALVSDQGGSLYGCGCRRERSVRLTLGTGTFLSLNTKHKPHASLAGLYPVVGFKEKDKKATFVAEGNSVDTGPMLDWCRRTGLFDNYEDLSRIATSVPDSGGVSFVPAFSGLQAPIKDDRAATGFIGVKPTTTKAHMVRAVLESFAFRVLQLWGIMKDETDVNAESFRVDGGVSQCEFLLQLISDLCRVNLECSPNPEMTALGAAQLAAQQTGFWTEEKIESMWETTRTYHPQDGVSETYKSTFESWKKATTRFQKWY